MNYKESKMNNIYMEASPHPENKIQKAPDQKKTPGYLQNIVQNLPKMSMKAIKMVIPALLAGGVVTQVSPDYQYTTTSKDNTTQHNPLNKDSIQTASNNNGRANVNVIVMPDGKCYVTNDHVTVDKVGLSEFRTMQKRYDIKVFEKSDGTKKISCKEQLLGLVKYQTNDRLNKHLEQNPQLELHTLHSSQKPNNADYSKLGRVPFSDTINEKEQVIKGKFLFGTSSNFWYEIEASENTQTAPGTSAGGLYDNKGEFVGMHSEANTLLNLKLYGDLLDPSSFDLNQLQETAIMPESNAQEINDKRNSVEKLKQQLVVKLTQSKKLSSESKAGYNTRLIEDLITAIGEEINQNGESSTLQILKTRDIKQIAKNGIKLRITDYQKTISETDILAKKQIYTERKQAIEQNQEIILEKILNGTQIVEGVHFSKQTLDPLKFKQ